MRVVLYEDQEGFDKVVAEARELCAARTDRQKRLADLDPHIFDSREKFEEWSGTEGFSLVSLAIVDLEIGLEDREGLRAVQVLRNATGSDNLPIVIFSKASTKKARELAYEVGVTSYVKKPATRGKLIQALADIFMYWVGLNERSTKNT